VLIEALRDGTNQWWSGTAQSGKTAHGRTAICAASDDHTPEQKRGKFYVRAIRARSLARWRGLPHVGGVAYGIDGTACGATIYRDDGAAGSAVKRSFPAGGVRLDGGGLPSAQVGGDDGEVPDDPNGDVFWS